MQQSEEHSGAVDLGGDKKCCMWPHWGESWGGKGKVDGMDCEDVSYNGSHSRIQVLCSFH